MLRARRASRRVRRRRATRVPTVACTSLMPKPKAAIISIPTTSSCEELSRALHVEPPSRPRETARKAATAPGSTGGGAGGAHSDGGGEARGSGNDGGSGAATAAAAAAGAVWAGRETAAEVADGAGAALAASTRVRRRRATRRAKAHWTRRAPQMPPGERPWHRRRRWCLLWHLLRRLQRRLLWSSHRHPRWAIACLVVAARLQQWWRAPQGLRAA